MRFPWVGVNKITGRLGLHTFTVKLLELYFFRYICFFVINLKEKLIV